MSANVVAAGAPAGAEDDLSRNGEAIHAAFIVPYFAVNFAGTSCTLCLRTHTSPAQVLVSLNG